MSTAPDNLANFGPAWNARPVPLISGQADTHIATGEDYPTRTLASLFTMEPAALDKMDGPAFIPSSYVDFDARVHKQQQQFGQFVALTGDVDSDDHPLETIQSLVTGFVKDAAWLIYSSPHARPGNRRWRIIIPLEREVTFNLWHDAQNAFFDFMEAHGVTMDRALARAGQLVFLPNVPATHSKTGEPLRGEDGAPLHYTRATSGTNARGLATSDPVIATYIATLRRQREAEQRERERLRKEAEERRRAKVEAGDGSSIIDDFNAANSIETLLQLYGYEQSPRNAEDWRSPHQTGESYATRNYGEFWISLSGSDAGVGLGQSCKMGCFGDAYDLLVHYEHGGDHKAAQRTLYAERRASQPGNWSEPPPLQADDPGPEPIEMAEEPDEMPDFDPPEPEETADTDTFQLLDLTELENLPPPEWLVDELLVQDGLTVIYGDPGAGKSFIGLDMALRISMGMAWHDREAKQVGVLYIAGEGARGLGKRVRGWRRKHRKTHGNVPFLLLPVPVAMLEADQRAKLLRTIDAAVIRGGFPIGLVVIDTVSRALAGAGENGADEMGAFVAVCDVVRLHIGGAVLGVHHRGKDKDKGMRGSTVLLGACDAAIRVEKAGEIVTLTTEKQKDAEEAPPIYMHMERVSWGEGEEHQSTLVPFLTADKPAVSEKMSDEQIRKAFQLLTEAWSAGKPLSTSPQVRNQGRYAPSVLSKVLECNEKLVAEYLTSWLENDCLAIEVFDQHSKSKGIRVLNTIMPGVMQ